MKITHVTTRVLRTPADNPLVVGLPAPTDTREFVTLELGTDQGLVGVGLTFFGGALTAALKVAVDTLAGLVVGDDPTQTEAIAAKLRRAAGSSEEHTSELQSPCNLVCRLLLEKKKKAIFHREGLAS